MKRLLDLILGLCILILFLPIGVLIALLLRLTGEGEVFYRQERIGIGGNPFGLLKFATMVKNSANMATGTVTVKNDPRVLPIGKFLRKTKLNEVPQIINVLKGDMSMVGPRPLTAQTFNFYSASVQAEIKKIKPGLTGVGSIVFRDEESIMARSSKPPIDCYQEDIAPHKGALELWYIQHKSFWLDLELIALTAAAVLLPRSRLHLKFLKDLPATPLALIPKVDKH